MSQLINTSPERFDYASGICSGGCTDYDMVWERKGRFRIHENKRPGEELSLGQLYALRAEVRRGSDVYIVVGYPPDEIVSFGRLDEDQIPTTLAALKDDVQAWWDAI